MTKSELVAALAARIKMSKAEAAKIIDALFAPDGLIAKELGSGRKVVITGFGTFEVRRRGARKGRNPKLGKEITIKASIGPLFKTGKGLEDLVRRKSEDWPPE